MNRLSIRVLACTTSSILALVMLASGCGPQDLNDPDYLMQMRNSGDTDLGNKEGADDAQLPQAPARPMQQNMQVNMPNTNAQAQPAQGALVANQVPAVGVAAVAIPEVISGPPAVVVAPTIVENLPPVVINTAEERRFGREIHHFRKIVRNLPSITQHTVNNIERVHHRYFTEIVNAPSHATQVCPTFSTYQTAEVMPTTEVTLPVAETIIPCYGVAGCVGPGLGLGLGGVGIGGPGFFNGRGLLGRF